LLVANVVLRKQRHCKASEPQGVEIDDQVTSGPITSAIGGTGEGVLREPLDHHSCAVAQAWTAVVRAD